MEDPLSTGLVRPHGPKACLAMFNKVGSDQYVNVSVMQYRPASLCSPCPPMRPCHHIDGLGLDWVQDLLPARDPTLSADIRKCLDYFVHAMVFSLDKDGRPVSCLDCVSLTPVALLVKWCLFQPHGLTSLSGHHFSPHAIVAKSELLSCSKLACCCEAAVHQASHAAQSWSQSSFAEHCTYNCIGSRWSLQGLDSCSQCCHTLPELLGSKHHLARLHPCCCLSISSSRLLKQLPGAV